MNATKRLTITCTETVTFDFTLTVPANATDEQIAELAETYWVEQGNRIDHFVSVEDRGFDWSEGDTLNAAQIRRGDQTLIDMLAPNSSHASTSNLAGG